MTRHASADELALLAVGTLRRRKAAKVGAHLAGCAQCTGVSQGLAAVSVDLASVHYPPMPDRISVRIEVALATESTQRLAIAPGTEAGRRDLPERRSASAGWRGWQLPGLSVAGTRLVAAAAGVAVIIGGGYALSSSLGGTVTSSSSGGSQAALPAPARQLSLGPTVKYGTPGSTHVIHVVSAKTNFTSAQLTSEATAAVRAAQLRGASAAGAPSATAPGPVDHTTLSSGAAGSAATSPGTTSQLAGCINSVAPRRTLLLVEDAKFEGTPATVIVTAATATSPAEAWVVGATCSENHTDVLAQAVLGNV
jgi:hypothetical protein